MNALQAAILGMVQGLTEFLPISSSGHLVLVPWLFGWPEHSLAFDAALHLGTSFALIGYFWRDWVGLIGAVLAGLRDWAARQDRRQADVDSTAAGGGSIDHQDDQTARQARSRRLAWLLVLGSLPAGLVGLVFESSIEQLVREPWLVAVLLIAFGLLMLAADRAAARRRDIGDVGLPDALIVGLAQVLALAPGVSRSGITITAGLLLGLDRPAAARFSFLLSAPITLAAALYSLRRLFGPQAQTADVGLTLLVGVASAAIFGILAISFLLRYLQRNSLATFVWYRVAVGLVVLILALVRTP